MSPQIEILEIVLLFIAIVLLTFGIAGLKFNLTDRLYFKFTFAGVLLLSFISILSAIFIHVFKFDIYFGWNAALLVLVLTVIISSPFILRIINSARLFKFSPGRTFRQIQPAEKMYEKPQLVREEKPIETHVFADEPKLKEEPIHIKSAEGSQPVEITSEPVKPAEVIASEEIPDEKSTKVTQPKKKTTRKRTPVKKTPSKIPAAKTKPRGKK